jgi:alkylation response protein AidB-like acyl-CoA dehydrogenase
MDFAWSEHATTLHSAATDFGRSLNEGLAERDASAEPDRDAWRRCAEFGVLGLAMPERYGGLEEELPTVVHALEGLGYGCRDNGLLFALGAQAWSVQMPILLFGSDEQRERFLPGLISGEILGAHSVTEPESGSDVFSLRTTAVRDADGYVLTGHKTFITSAPIADVFLVVATVDPERGAGGLTAFLVDKGTAGLSVAEPDEKMGLRTSAMGDVYLDGCRVGEDQVLGRVGGGSAVFGAAMEWERAYILAPALGAMQRQVEQCIEYARARRQFGKPIGKNQSVSGAIVDMQLRLDTSRLLTYRTAALKQTGKRMTFEPSQVKLHVSESWVENSLAALQLHGGSGYMRELGLERELRDAVASRIYSGTSQIQRVIIASYLGL